MHRLWNYLRRHRGKLTIALILAAINQIFSLLDPQIFRIVVDKYASQADAFTREAFLQGVIILLLASVGIALVSRIAKSFQDYYVSSITQRVGTEMYSASVEHAFSLPYSAFEDQRSGELLGKLQSARTDSQGLIRDSINILFLSLIGIIFVIIYGFIVHWSIGLAFLVAVPTLGVVTFFTSRGIKEAQRKIVSETTDLAGSTTETIRNVELVKSLGLEEQEVERLNTVNERILQLELRKIILIRRLHFIQGTVVNATRSALQLLMFSLIFAGVMTIGEYFSLLIYSFFVFSPLAEIATVATGYQSAQASLEKLNEALAIPTEPQNPDAKRIASLESITMQDVAFRHQSAEHDALAGVSLSIRAGETVAFVGPSGSGKTTIIKLLVGLYKPSRGSIAINGIDAAKFDYDDFRMKIGFVAQETQLFAGTIRENLLFVKPKASDAECMAALKAAAADSILQRSTKGLDTRIGEGGLKLSGGERQRLAIARALLRNPMLLIFDEATSSLDSLTERSITETIRTISTERAQVTTVLVAHRLSTVAHADRIYVLERGRINESGTHDELLKSGGLYAALWREQTASSASQTQG